MDELEQLGLLLDVVELDKNGKPLIGEVVSKEKGTFRAYKHKVSKKPIFLGSSLKPKSKEELKTINEDFLYGKIGKNMVAYTSAWTWE